MAKVSFAESVALATVPAHTIQDDYKERFIAPLPRPIHLGPLNWSFPIEEYPFTRLPDNGASVKSKVWVARDLDRCADKEPVKMQAGQRRATRAPTPLSPLASFSRKTSPWAHRLEDQHCKLRKWAPRVAEGSIGPDHHDLADPSNDVLVARIVARADLHVLRP